MISIFAGLIIILSYCIVFIPGYFMVNYNLMLTGILVIWLVNVITALADVRRNIIFLFFNFAFFTFLLSRPVISMIRGDKWWYFNQKNVLFAMTVLVLAVTFLFVGKEIGDKVVRYRKGKMKKSPEVYNSRNIKIISMIVYAVSLAAYFILELEKLVYVSQYSYTAYYSNFVSKAPYIIYVISTFFKYSLCMFLITRPSKQEAFIPLAFYLLSAVPQLLIGIRNPIVLNAIFIFLYYCIRDIMGDKEKWLGKAERTVILLFLPFILAFLGVYNYIREDRAVENGMGIFSLIVDLFYKQGVSFDVLCIAYGTIPYLPERTIRNYTFGGFIDYFTHGTIAQLLGGKGLLPGNNLEQALYSNSFAHNMSYIAKGQDYLEGHGFGSSYILETFVDYGYAGVVISSIIFGFLCIYAMRLVQLNKYTFYVTLIGLTSLFFVPRAETTGWLTFLLTAQFWISTLVIVFASGLCIKSCHNRNLKYKGAV